MPGLYLFSVVQFVANPDAVLWDRSWLVTIHIVTIYS